MTSMKMRMVVVNKFEVLPYKNEDESEPTSLRLRSKKNNN